MFRHLVIAIAVSGLVMGVAAKCSAQSASTAANAVVVHFGWPKDVSRKLQIQIDADRNWKTGYKGNKVGAEFLLQVSDGTCSMNRYKGSGFDWEWTLIGSCQLTSANHGELIVAVFKPSDFGVTQDFDYEVQTLNSDWSIDEDQRPTTLRLDRSPIDQLILNKKHASR